MSTKTLTLFSALFSLQLTLAQEKIDYRPSIDIYSDASIAIDNNELIKAITFLEEINPNDTAYQKAQEIIIGCNIDLKNYEKVLELCDQHLDSHYFIDQHKLYSYKLESLYKLEKYDELDKAFEIAIQEYPNSAELYFHKAKSLEKQDKFDNAVTHYQKAILYNPYKQLYHFNLGLLYIDANQLTRGLMALDFCVLLNSTSNTGVSTLKFLNDFASGNYTPEKEISLKDEDQSLYTEMDLIIKNKIALDTKYKASNKLDYNITRQNQLMFETLKFKEKNTDFCNQNYMRFFSAMFKKNYFNEFTYHQFTGIDVADVQKIVEKNSAKTSIFMNWARHEMDKAMYYRTYKNNEKTESAKSLYSGNFGIEAFGEMNQNFKPIGKWTYLNSSGKVSVEINYSQESVKEGISTGYYENGKVYYTVNYSNDKVNGEKEIFYDNGSRQVITSAVNGLNDGNYKEYFPTNVIRYETQMSKGLETEYYNTFHPDGSENAKMLVSNNSINGDYISYYPNGKPSEKAVFSNGKREGKTTTYYSNGKLSSEGSYSSGLKEGNWVYYYENGQISSKGSYKKDIAVGVWEDFHMNGKLEERADYGINGKKTGVVQLFNTSGKVIQELTYNGDDIVKYVFKDTNNNTLSEGDIEKKEIHVLGKYPNGNPSVEGVYKKSERVGKWKFYSANGVLNSIENYNEEGLLDGKTTNYFGDGRIENVTRYKEGLKEGYYEDYYLDGELYEQGNYCEDKRCGLWESYYKNGKTRVSTYYLNDEPVGFQSYFDAEGKLFERYSYEDGYYKEYIRYDTNGNEINHFYFNKETQNVEYKNILGGKFLTCSFKGSMLSGEAKWYHYGEQLNVEGNFLNDNREGLFVYFDVNGKKTSEANYLYGQLHGKSLSYFDNGKLKQEGNYYHGNQTGIWKNYNEDGSLYSTLDFHNGLKHGKEVFYVNNEIACIKYYYEGSFYAFSYIDKSGNVTTPTLMKDGTGNLLAYYKNGQKSYEINFTNGLANGEFKRWYPDGTIYKEGVYKSDYLQGSFKVYFSNGKLMKDENYTDDKLSGLNTYYAENGKKVSSFNYKMGTKYGKATYYDESGEVSSEYLFYNDNAIKKIK